jgi:peroxiredoxin Q/BCP
MCEDKTLIVFFYPYDNSPGCVTQSCAIRDNWPLLQSENIDVVGVNSGSASSHANFRGKYGLPFALLVDRDHELAHAFGFVHRLPGLSGTPSRVERSTVIIDPGGTIRAVLRKVKPDAHFEMLRVNLGLSASSTTAE